MVAVWEQARRRWFRRPAVHSVNPPLCAGPPSLWNGARPAGPLGKRAQQLRQEAPGTAPKSRRVSWRHGGYWVFRLSSARGVHLSGWLPDLGAATNSRSAGSFCATR
ncbi:hypothetical protein GmRootA79_20920 [Acidovorax sp. A79]